MAVKHIDILVRLRYLKFSNLSIPSDESFYIIITGGMKVSKPEGYIGTLAITWEDGDKNLFEIAQSRGHIWVGDHFVSSRNEKSLQGILREISEVMGHTPRRVRQYTWVELLKPIQYPK